MYQFDFHKLVIGQSALHLSSNWFVFLKEELVSDEQKDRNIKFVLTMCQYCHVFVSLCNMTIRIESPKHSSLQYIEYCMVT
jgi:hypothetical protein